MLETLVDLDTFVTYFNIFKLLINVLNFNFIREYKLKLTKNEIHLINLNTYY